MTQRPVTPDLSGVTDEMAINSMEGSRMGNLMLGVVGYVRGRVKGGAEAYSLAQLAHRLKIVEDEDQARIEAIRAKERELEVAQQELNARTERLAEQTASLAADGGSSASTREVEEVVRQQLEALTSPEENNEQELVEAPVEFSELDTLTTPTKYESRKVFFTCLNARSKFTGQRDGATKYGELDVVSLLESLTQGQRHLKLSLLEFINVFTSSCAGAPQSLLIEHSADLVAGNMTVQELYRIFTDCYFYELRPEAALARLRGLKQKHTFSGLADADLQIRKLAHLASLGEETQERRALFYQKYYRETLLGIIPDKFISLILDKINKKKALSGRTELSPNEIIAICRTFRVQLDTMFYRKSQNSSSNDGQAKKASGNSGGRKAKKQKGGGGNANVNAVTRSQSQQNNSPQQPNPQQQPKPQTNGNGNGNNRNNGNGNGRGGNNSKGNGSGNGKGENGNSNKNNGSNGGNQNGGRNWNKKLEFDGCKLCMQMQHTYQNCPLFKEFERIVASNPCHCAMKAFHLPKFCPLKSKN